MAKRHKKRARERRVELMLLLGYCCKHCNIEENLEFDCIKPCGDEHHRMDTSHRMSFYFKQYRLGNLQILCTKCHNKKSSNELGFIVPPNDIEQQSEPF